MQTLTRYLQRDPQRDLEHDEIVETRAQLYALGQYLDTLEPTSDGTRASIPCSLAPNQVRTCS